MEIVSTESPQASQKNNTVTVVTTVIRGLSNSGNSDDPDRTSMFKNEPTANFFKCDFSYS